MPATARAEPKPKQDADWKGSLPATIGARKHIWPPRRWRTTPDIVGNTLADRVVRFIAPWEQCEYPGRGRLILSLLPRAVTVKSVTHWRREARRLPADIAEALSLHLRGVASRALELATELEGHAASRRAELHRRTGFAEIGPDGRDKRLWRR